MSVFVYFPLVSHLRSLLLSFLFYDVFLPNTSYKFLFRYVSRASKLVRMRPPPPHARTHTNTHEHTHTSIVRKKKRISRFCVCACLVVPFTYWLILYRIEGGDSYVLGNVGELGHYNTMTSPKNENKIAVTLD
jgi:hypothetical protein